MEKSLFFFNFVVLKMRPFSGPVFWTTKFFNKSSFYKKGVGSFWDRILALKTCNSFWKKVSKFSGSKVPGFWKKFKRQFMWLKSGMGRLLQPPSSGTATRSARRNKGQ